MKGKAAKPALIMKEPVVSIKKFVSEHLFQIVVGIVIIGFSFLIAFFLYYNKPIAQKALYEEPETTYVEVIEVHETAEPVSVNVYGTVQPNRELIVQAEVSGRVIEQNPNLDAGGLLSEGEIMLKIDPRNYITAVEQEKSNLEKALFDLKVEQGKKIVAEREWELLDPSIQGSDVGKELALRTAHIKQKEAAIQAARSSLEKAELDLERTVMRAPFNALVLEEFVEIGQLLSPQTKVAKIVSTDEFRVQVSVPFDELSWITIPQKSGEKGAPVTIVQDLGDSEKIERKGHVLRLLGSLDPNGRMARLLVVIEDPLGIHNPEFRTIPLLIDTYVGVHIIGPTINNVFKLPRRALREGDRVWVLGDDNRLVVREVNVVSRTKDEVMVKGLGDGERVVISSLPVAIPGMELKVIE